MLWLCLIIVFMFLSISKTHQKTKTTTGDMLAHFNKYGCCCFLMMWSHIHRPAALHTDSPSLHLENVPNKHTLYSCISNLLKPTFSSCNVTVLFWEDKVNLTKKWCWCYVIFSRHKCVTDRLKKLEGSETDTALLTLFQNMEYGQWVSRSNFYTGCTSVPNFIKLISGKDFSAVHCWKITWKSIFSPKAADFQAHQLNQWKCSVELAPWSPGQLYLWSYCIVCQL